MNRNNQAEQMKAPGFWYTFLHTIKASFLSRDTILIFAGAIAFYLIFYAWPYGNQQIQHVPSAVLDLDRSAAARRLVTAMDASPAISVVRITQDEGEAMEAFRREEFSVLITIPKDFEKSLTRGENVTVHVLGNGAFPVKARAVQAALGGVVTDKTKLLDDAAVYATGLPGTSVHSHHQAAPGLRVQYMYNEIGGYGNYTVPVVGPVIIQAVMLMAITMALGGWLVAARREPFVEAALDRPLHRGAAVWLAFTLITFLWFVYMQGFDFWWHEYGSMRSVAATLGTGLLFSVSVASFGMVVTILLGSNRWSSQAVVMISAPAVFISGGIWPMTNVLSEPVFALSLFIPTSPAVPALLAASQDGALTESILPYWGILGIQTLFYLSTALHLVHRRDWREDAVQAYSRGALRREPFVKTDRPSDWDY